MSQLNGHSLAHIEARLALGRAVLQQHGVLRLKVVGGVSMWPTLRVGDDLDLEADTSPEIEVGEIVVCQRSGRLIAHRVIEVDRGQGEQVRLRCKGDTHLRADAPVWQHDLVGRVVSRQRCGRTTRLDRGMRRQIGRFLSCRGNPLPVMLATYRSIRRRMSARRALGKRANSSHNLAG